jgi:hypothetical protein
MEVKYEDFLKLREDNLNLREELFELKKIVENLSKNANFSKEEKNQEKLKTNKIQVIKTKKSKSNYDALIEFRTKQNKKEILKQKLMELVGNGVTLSELKFLFVDYHKYTSKATFYSYFKELEFEKQINQEISKNKKAYVTLSFTKIKVSN